MPHQLLFTRFLNQVFGEMTTAMLRHIGIEPRYPSAPINNTVSMEILVCLLLIIFFLIVRSRLSVERPGGLQHIVEITNDFIGEQASQIIGHGYEGYVPYITALGFFILIGNLIGIIPGLESPTASPAVPLGCAITTFLYYHYYGIREHGVSYIKQFLGPVLSLSWLMLPIELVSHAARILSLTVRLFANMFAGEMVTMSFFSLIPILVPVAFIGLHVFVGFVQAFIFVMLTMAYIGMAVSHEH